MKPSDEIKKLEARTYYEQNYDEYEVEDLMDVYECVAKHVGFTDNRRDSRFIVKFHDIFWHSPEEFTNTDTFNSLFEDFCACTYDNIMDELREQNINVKSLLSNRPCGHYDAFVVDIPEITKDNAIELAEKIYNEVGNGTSYVEDYIYTVNALQALEDNYMEDWLVFIEGIEEIDKYRLETEQHYKEEKEKHEKA